MTVYTLRVNGCIQFLRDGYTVVADERVSIYIGTTTHFLEVFHGSIVINGRRITHAGCDGSFRYHLRDNDYFVIGTLCCLFRAIHN